MFERVYSFICFLTHLLSINKSKKTSTSNFYGITNHYLPAFAKLIGNIEYSHLFSKLKQLHLHFRKKKKDAFVEIKETHVKELMHEVEISGLDSVDDQEKIMMILGDLRPNQAFSGCPRL